MSNLRPISTEHLEPVRRTVPTANQPIMGWLPIDHLVVDGDYQRPLDRSNWTQIRKIAKAFDWAHFTPVVVARLDDGLFSIIDGQHRCHAAQLVGELTVPCVIHDLTPQQQARAFAAINAQVTAVSGFHLYRAALAACEPWAVTAEKVVADAGCRMMKSKPSQVSKKAGEIYSPVLIRKTVDAGHAATITPVLSGLWQSPNSDDPLLWSNTVLLCCLQLVREHPRALRRDLGGFFRQHCPLATLRGAEKIRAQDAYRDKSRRELFVRLLNAQMAKWLEEGGA